MFNGKHRKRKRGEVIVVDHAEESEETLPLLKRDVFVTDAIEINGRLVLFGREGCTSICAVIENPRRSVYLELRKNHLPGDLEKEFSQRVAPALGLEAGSFEVEIVTKRYAFAAQELPSQRVYLEVRHTGAVRDWQRHPSGQGFTKVLGAKNKLLEQFLLQNKLRLPCYVTVDTKPRWSCREGLPPTSCMETVIATSVELSTTIPHTEATHSAPLLVVLALELTFVADCLSAFSLAAKMRYRGSYANINESWHRQSCAVSGDLVEGDVLAALAAAVELADPDVVLGHGLFRDLPLLMQRFNLLFVDASGMGRLLQRRYEATEFDLSCQQREALCGRVVIDLKTLCQEAQLPSRDYERASLLEAVLDGVGFTAPLQTVDQLFVLEMAFGGIKLVFELSRLTSATPACVARLGRAHRVEKMLAAEFYANGYILPEKVYKEFSPKSGYTGGLVLEPTLGVLRNQSILLDYHALYPNIIIENKICFVTPELHPAFVQGSAELEERLDPVLPGLMSRLLAERWVATSAASSTDGADHRRWETREKALKMSANAIYGCLGSTAGRFPAVHLAAHIAERGRSLLGDTVSTVTNMGHEIVYGDTDSLVIKTNTRDTEISQRIATKILDRVNAPASRFQMKLESVFDRLIIVAKKNYAGQRADVPGLHQPEVVVKGMMGGRPSNPRAMQPLFKEVLAVVWSDHTTKRDLVAVLSQFRLKLASIPPRDLSASATLHRNVWEYTAAPLVAVIAKRLIETRGARIGPGDSLEILPVLQDSSQGSQVSKGSYYVTLAEIEATGKPVDILEWTASYLLPALRQVAIGVSSFEPPMQLVQLVSFLGLETAPYVHAEPLLPPVMKNNPLLSAETTNKKHISVKCPLCFWSVPLNNDGFNKEKRAFTLQRCQNLKCKWQPFQDVDYVSKMVAVTSFEQAQYVGFDQCSAQIKAIRQSLKVPKGATNPQLVQAYGQVLAAHDAMLAQHPWGGQRLDFTKMAAKRLEEKLKLNKTSNLQIQPERCAP